MSPKVMSVRSVPRALARAIIASTGSTAASRAAMNSGSSSGIIDGLDLVELDYVDVGEMIQPANVVPVVVKSLAFPGAAAAVEAARAAVR